jgi:hypothetical protein
MNSDAKALVIAAFESARKAKKPDWYRMNSSVLKNRILAARKSFDLRDYGVESFPEFIRLCEDIVVYDPSTRPPSVMFKQDQATPERQQPPRGQWRVRPDLWTAAIDYSSGRKYVWDKGLEAAREATDGDDQELVISPVTQEDVKAWRESFCDQVAAGVDPDVRERLDHWRNDLQQKTVPHSLFVQWNEFQKQRVMSHVGDWFRRRQMSVPPDIRHDVVGGVVPTNVTALRRMIVRVVHAMTQRELEDLKLPAAAVHRASRPTQSQE